ncbi:MAG: alkaline phosphatase D family protein [Gemmataceae bacterium]|nr:alkaline phosphatase D family protein [Gemmataceae bacterium]
MRRCILSVMALAVHLSPVHAGAAPVERIAFGSCVHQDKPQPVWDAIVATRPQLFLMIGDNIYHDVTHDKSRKNDTLAQKYARLDAQPGFRKLRQSCPLLATWDDHDYGLNDAGASYPLRRESQQAFVDFAGVPADSPRRRQEGVYHAEIFGPADKSVQVLLLDTRYFRGPLKKRAKFFPGEGPYEPSSDTAASMLGDTQWKWLADQLKKPAAVRILVSSIQVVPQDHHWEKWHNLPHERDRLFKLIRATGAAGLFCISGDRHLAELSMMDAGIGYPLYDLTSSGLNQGFGKWRKLETNRHRVMTMNTGNNFGVITIDWSRPDPRLSLQIRDEAGDIAIQERVPLSVLKPGTLKAKSAAAAAKINGRIVTPDLVQELLKKEVTLEMNVNATGAAAGLIFLNSAEDRKNPDNFTIVLDKKAQEKLSQDGIANPRSHFEGKAIRVTGVLSTFRGTPQIIVSDPKQIKVLPK